MDAYLSAPGVELVVSEDLYSLEIVTHRHKKVHLKAERSKKNFHTRYFW